MLANGHEVYVRRTLRPRSGRVGGATLLAIAMLSLAATAHGQGVAAHPNVGSVSDVPVGEGTIRGRVVHANRPDAAAGLPVVLYALSSGGDAGLRAGTTDAAGMFIFEGVDAAPATVYLVGSKVGDIPFGTRVRFEPGSREATVELQVSDPSADTSVLRTGEVRLFVDRGCDSLRVNELHELRNPTDRVLFVPPAERAGRVPLLRASLPEGAADLQSPVGGIEDNLTLEAGVMDYWGPLHPGTQIVELSYSLPESDGPIRFERRIVHPTELFRVLHRDGQAPATGGALGVGEPVEMEGALFGSAMAESLGRGAPLAFEVTAPPPGAAPDGLRTTQGEFWLELDDALLTVNEQYLLEADGHLPVRSASGGPLLCVPLPEAAEALRFSADSLALGLFQDASGALAVHGPIPPGQTTLRLRYQLPGTDTSLDFEREFAAHLPRVSMLIADTGILIDTERLHRRRPFRDESRTYEHLEAFEIEAGEVIRVGLTRLELGRRMPRLASAGAISLAALATLALLAAPLRRESHELLAGESEATRAAAERSAVYAAIRDLDHDFETGKLNETDRDRMRSELREQAVALMRLERDGMRTEGDPPDAASQTDSPVCGACNEPLTPGARFCAQCGAPTEGASREGSGAA